MLPIRAIRPTRRGDELQALAGRPATENGSASGLGRRERFNKVHSSHSRHQNTTEIGPEHGPGRSRDETVLNS
jgi:hypothetical protein